MNKNIGKILKESRISSGISVKEISDILVSKGYKASESTIYSWENENSQPTPGAFLVMCGTYGIKNVLNTFGYNGYNEDGSLQLNMKEIDMVEKYRFISTHSPDGASVVDAVLDREYTIADRLRKQKEQIQRMNVEISSETIPMRVMPYYQKMASAGSGEYLFDDIPTDLIEIEDTDIARKANFVLGVNGDSMFPTYKDGEKVFVRKASEIPTGKIGVFTIGNNCYIKELGVDRLISHNEDKETYPDILEVESANLVGEVIGKINE